MRKIETEMCKAIVDRRDWSKDNTRVHFTCTGLGRVYLHGNHIADATRNYYGSIVITPNHETLADWPTPTTKSRLRALGVNLTQKAGVISIDGEVVCHA
jgi:hypothetical protein